MKKLAALLPFELAFSLAPAEHDQNRDPSLPDAWWTCRYCHAGEGPARITLKAEAGRAITHQVVCTSRPATDPVTDHERQIMTDYLTAWLAPHLDTIDAAVADLTAQQKLRLTPETATELGRWLVRRAQYAALLEMCGATA